jgi:phage terminase large subunit
MEENLPKLMIAWRENPTQFIEDVLRQTPLEWQKKLLTAVANAKRGIPNRGDQCLKRFAVKSGVGVGKTFSVASLVIWMLLCFRDTKIPCTAPTSPQLKAVLLPEIRKLISGIPEKIKQYFPIEAQTDRVIMGDNMAVMRTSDEYHPEAFQGFHATNIALVADEGPGVPDAIFLAGQGVMSENGAVTLIIGNPNRGSGYFFDCFNANSDMWWTLTVSAFDSPRVSKEFIEDMKRQHGEDSYEYKVRVLGEFSLENSGIIIPMPWVREAMGKEIEPDGDYIVWGFDVSDGRDRSALVRRCGNKVSQVESWGGKSVMQSIGYVADCYLECKESERPDEICVDAIGMGATAAQRLAEVLKGEPVKITKVIVSLTGQNVGDRFVSHRVELWDRGRKWFESGAVSIPSQATRLAAQLSSVEWEVNDSNGKWKITDKKAAGSSPDEADALLLTFSGLKRGRSSFTKDSKGRRIVTSNETAGVGSASYLKQGA